MKKLLFILLVSLPSLVFSQHTEFGFLLGASNYMGELSNNNSTIYFQETKPAIGVFGKYNLNELLAVRLGFNYGAIAGQDSNSPNQAIKTRNFSFRSNLYEFGLTGELNVPGYQPYNLDRPLSAFIFGGIALTKFNPKARYNDNLVALQPLGTEGQGISGYETPYSRILFAIPFGIGVKYALNDAINLGLEVGARYTFTDYLDDVGGVYADHIELLAGNGEIAAALGNRSTFNNEPITVEAGTARGVSSNNDWYFITGITLSYNFLDNGLVGIRKRTRRRSGCPN